MERFKIKGKKKVSISRIGMGTGYPGMLFGGDCTYKDVKNLFKEAYEQGINFFDTAVVYEAGRKMEKLVRRFAEKREIVIGTKLPAKGKPPLEKSPDIEDYYPLEYVRQKLMESIENLGKETTKLMMLHNWHPEWNRTGEEVLEFLEKFKGEWGINSIGISLPDWMNTGLSENIWKKVDFLMIPLNLFQQWPIKEILPDAKKYNVPMIARSVFYHGLLVGVLEGKGELSSFISKKFGGKTDKVKDKIDQLKKEIGSYKKIAAYAEQFCLIQDQVESAVLGMSSKEEIREDVENLKIEFSQEELSRGRDFGWGKNLEEYERTKEVK